MERKFIGKRVRFQITANTGETLGLPLDTWDAGSLIAKSIIENENLLQELCPDSDITEITTLELVPTVEY